MAISTPKLIGIFSVIGFSLILIFALLFSSIVPQYSMGELFEKNDLQSMIGKKIQIVGDVGEIKNGQFTLLDWEQLNYSIQVDHQNVPLPNGFGEGKRVLVEGKLIYVNGNLHLEASQVSTKCPSKYESA